MKKKLIIGTIVILLLIFPFVSSDIISLNSGGTNQLVFNPNNYLEGFFLWANRLPVAFNLILNSTSGQNSTNDNLTISYSVSDADGDAITNITDWRLNGNSIAVLNFPFNKRVFSTGAGAVRDYSSYANNGTLGGGTLGYSPNWTRTCQEGGCYAFDGVNDYILTGLPQTFGSSGNFTISAWINSSSLSGTSTVFSYGYGNHGYGRIFVGTSSFRGFLNLYTGSQYLPVTGTSTLSTDQWYLITGVYSRSTNNISLYINGNYENSTSWNGNIESEDAANSRLIGCLYKSSGNTGYFRGLIDDVLIFNRSLSAEAIKEIYSTGVAHRGLEKMVSQELSNGDSWRVALTPNDVWDDGITIFSNNLIIANVAPYDPTNVKLLSLNGRNESNTDLNCSAYISDADNSGLSVFVRWIKNGTLQFTSQFDSQNNNSLFWTLLSSGNLTLGDVWKCSVRTYDSLNYSNWIDSNNLTIIDITPPNISIISPNSTYNYTTLEVDFNISISENENISKCFYSLNGTANVSMWRFNDSYFWYEPQNLIPGLNNVTFWCNDTSGNWGTNFTNFTILSEAAISIQLSPALSMSVNWTLISLPANYLDATGNNGPNSTDYFINISTSGIGADIYVEADDDLYDLDLDVLKLGNETYSVNTTNGTVPNTNKINMTTSYVLIGDNMGNNTVIYMKFYLNAPSGQPAGIYTNNLAFKAVVHGQAP